MSFPGLISVAQNRHVKTERDQQTANPPTIYNSSKNSCIISGLHNGWFDW